MAPEALDAADGVLGPSLHDPLHGDVVGGGVFENRLDVAGSDAPGGLGLERRQLESLRSVDDLEAQFPDAIAQRVGRGKVPGRPALPAFRREPASLVAHRCLRMQP